MSDFLQVRLSIGTMGQASLPSCRYYKAQQAGEEWRENGMVDPSTLAGLEEDSQRRVGVHRCPTPASAPSMLARGCNRFCAPSNEREAPRTSLS